MSSVLKHYNSFAGGIAEILRAKETDILEFFSKMDAITSKRNIMEEIVFENNALVERTLLELGLVNEDRTSPGFAEKIHNTLIGYLEASDAALFEILGRPDLTKQESVMSLIQAKVLSGIQRGFFIKESVARNFLIQNPPPTIIRVLGYKDVNELLEKESIWEIYPALRFLESGEWMNKVFLRAYKNLKPEDFEERELRLLVLPTKWLALTEKFMEKKYHNVSHLKELGVIFVIPISLDIPGDTMRLFALLLHYFHEVPFYSKLFREYTGQNDGFADNIISLLRGDVLEEPLPDPGPGKVNIRIVQRYLAKDNPQDPRLFEPHVNPETRHWDWAEADLTRLDHEHPTLHLGFWAGLNWVGGRFLDKNGENEIVGFNLIDVVMSLIKQKEMIKYLYHHQEAFWNQIFIRYIGTQEMDKLIEQNIIKGYFTLG